MGDTARNYRNTGVVVCDGSATVYLLTGETIATAIGLPAGTQTRVDAKTAKDGWNNLTVAVRGLTGGKTWKFEASVGGWWVELASSLPTDVAVCSHGIGPQAGLHNAATPAFRAFPAFRADAYRVTLSAADAAGRIHLIVEGFDE